MRLSNSDINRLEKDLNIEINGFYDQVSIDQYIVNSFNGYYISKIIECQKTNRKKTKPIFNFKVSGKELIKLIQCLKESHAKGDQK